MQTGEFPGWDRSQVSVIKIRAVSQFTTIATTKAVCHDLAPHAKTVIDAANALRLLSSVSRSIANWPCFNWL